MVKVSIGLPVFNGEKYLRTTLDSILNQTFSNFELIISDNASKDETQRICSEYQKRDQRIKYIRQENNLGPFANVEFLMRAATSPYFMLVGDDDLYDQTYIEKMYAMAESDPTLGLIFSDFAYVLPNNTIVSASDRIIYSQYDSHRFGFIKFLFKRSALPMMMGLFRKEIMLKSIPFYDRELAPMSGDVDNIFLANYLSFQKPCKVPGVLFFYRVKETSSWQSKRGFPPDWPDVFFGQLWYMFKHHIKVARYINVAILQGSFGLADKVLLSCIHIFASFYLFFHYLAIRIFAKLKSLF